ncbi:MAG: MarR family transcriptional regulator [Kordiimonadaceae bacterium]|nr:MarR family transcriptional regulator [Kordiimonadaceae bacterium]
MNQDTDMTEEQLLSKQRLRLWVRLLRATKLIENEIREHLRTEFETTLPRFDVMAALYRAENGLKMSELSQALMVSNGNVTGLIDRLSKDGLVARVAIAGDRRSTRVELTAEGATFFEKLAKSHETRIDTLFSEVDFDDAAGIITRLARIDGDDGE